MIFPSPPYFQEFDVYNKLILFTRVLPLKLTCSCIQNDIIVLLEFFRFYVIWAILSHIEFSYLYMATTAPHASFVLSDYPTIFFDTQEVSKPDSSHPLNEVRERSQEHLVMNRTYLNHEL